MTQKKERAARRTNKQLENDVMSALEALITERGFMNTSLLSFLKMAGIDANVFYRHYGTLEQLYDKFIDQYDFRLYDTQNSNMYKLENRQFCIKALKKLYVGLEKNMIMQKILLWELSNPNPTTRKTAAIRERMSLDIMKYISTVFSRTSIDIQPIATLLVAGVYYIILHRRNSAFCTLDFKTDHERKRIFKAIDMLVNLLFDKLEQEQRYKKMALRMKKDNISEEKIAYYLGV